MAWTTPKTDWTVGTDDTNYNGDRFTYRDFNRIKNNILYLYDLAEQLYPIDDIVAKREADTRAWLNGTGKTEDYFLLIDGYADRTVSSYVYADEINYFEERLDFLNTLVGNIAGGQKQRYYPNGVFINAPELNRLEKMCVRFEDFLQNKYISRRRFAFKLSQNTNHMDL